MKKFTNKQFNTFLRLWNHSKYLKMFSDLTLSTDASGFDPGIQVKEKWTITSNCELHYAQECNKDREVLARFCILFGELLQDNPIEIVDKRVDK